MLKTVLQAEIFQALNTVVSILCFKNIPTGAEMLLQKCLSLLPSNMQNCDVKHANRRYLTVHIPTPSYVKNAVGFINRY